MNSPDEPTRSLPDGVGPSTKSFAPHGLTTTLHAPFPATPAELTVVADRYELGAEIARGGMGVVYAARDRVLNRDVAVKLLQSRFAPDSTTARRFVEEARIAGQLQHPGVPPVHDLGTMPDGRPFLAMKLIRGETLSKILASRVSHVPGAADVGDSPRAANNLEARNGPKHPGVNTPGSPGLDTFLEICQTVAYAHDKGVVHRDLKPANVMVGAFGEVQVMDWGLAKVMRNVEFGMRNEDDNTQEEKEDKSVIETDRTPDSATQAGSVLGTPAYMPPEQAKGEVEKMDARTDVFALGAVLCELLTGKPPYTGTFDEIRARSIIGDLGPAKARLAACGGDPPLVELAEQCLHPDPADRPANAGAVAAAVAAYRDGVAAKLERAERERAEAVVRLGEQRKRRRVWYALAACLVAGLAASLALAGWALESRSEARYAEGVAARNLLDTIDAKKQADARRIEAEAEKARAERELDRADRLNYANQLAEADRHWREWNPTLYFDRLNAIRWDYRGPEWNHFWHRAHDHVVLRGHKNAVRCVAISPDGKRIASGSDGHTIRVWDANTLAPLGELNGHAAEINSVVFSPDGKRIVSGSSDKTIRVWQGTSPVTVAVLKGHTNTVSGVAISPDGRRIVSGSDDHTVRIWDATTFAPLAELKGHRGSVQGVAVSPDGRRIVSGSLDRVVRVWDATTFAPLAELKGHTDLVAGVAVSPDGRRIASGSFDNTARVWDATTFAPLKVLKGHTDSVTAVTFGPDGRDLVTGSTDNTLRVWDLGRPDFLSVLKGHRHAVSGLAVSPDGRRIVSASIDMSLRVWDRAPPAVIRPNEDSVYSVTVTPDGRRIASGGFDGFVRLWDAHTFAPLAAWDDHTKPVLCVAVSRDGTRVVSGADDRTVRVRDATTFDPLAVLKGHAKSVRGVAFVPDGRRIVSASDDHTIRVWDAVAFAPLAVLTGHDGSVNDVEVSPDGRRIVSASDDGSVRIWDAATFALLAVLKGHTGAVRDVTLSPDGRRIASGGVDHTVRVWDATTFAPLAELFGHTNTVNSVAYTPDGRRIVSGSDDLTVRTWDATSFAPLAELRGHEGSVLSVVAFPDGRRFASGSSDNTLRVWDVAAPARRPVTVPDPDVRTARYGPGGATIVLETGSGRFAVDAKTGRVLNAPIAGPPDGPAPPTDGSNTLVVDEGRAYEVNAGAERREADERAMRIAAAARPDPDWHRQRYADAVDSIDAYAARFHLRQIVRTVPTDFEAVVHLAAVDRIVGAAEARKQAQSFFTEGNYASELVLWTKAVELHPTYDNYVSYCVSLENNGAPYEAYRTFRQALAENRDWNRDHFADTHLATLAIRAIAKTKGSPQTPERKRDLRHHALALLNAELGECRALLTRNPDRNAFTVHTHLTDRLRDRDFAFLRLGWPNAFVPSDEMAAWAKLWADARALRAEAETALVGP